jgi:hypothetical protein
VIEAHETAVADGLFDYDRVVAVRRHRSGAVRVLCYGDDPRLLEDCVYYFSGYEIRCDSTLGHGFYGRYSATPEHGLTVTMRAGSLTEIVAEIRAALKEG